MKKWLAKYVILLMTLAAAVVIINRSDAAAGMIRAGGFLSTVERAEESAAEESGVLSELLYINPVFRRYLDEDTARKLLSSVGQAPVTAAEYDNHADAADYLRSQMVARNTSINIQMVMDRTPTNADMRTIFEQAIAYSDSTASYEADAIRGDYLAWKSSGNFFSRKGVYYVTLVYSITYCTDADQEAQLQARVKSEVAALGIANSSEYDKVKAIHDFICRTVKYDNANLNNSAYKLKFSAYAALFHQSAVCQGYVTLFYRMCREVGLSVRMVTGEGITSRGSENHAWNIVRIGNVYYNMDTTWDTGSSVKYDYFLKSNADFGKDHIRDAEYTSAAFNSSFPMASSSYPTPGGPVNPPTPGGSLSLNVTTKTIGTKQKFALTVSTSSGTKPSGLTWTSNNPGVATVSSSGLVTGVKAGTATVTVRDSSGASASCSFTVKALVSSGIKAQGSGKNQVTVRWDAVQDADGYIIYAKKNNVYAYAWLITNKATTSWTDNKAVEEDYNFYWVYPYCLNSDGTRAMGFSGKYAYAKGRASASSSSKLPGVTNLKATSVAGGVTLSWDAVNGATGYLIYYKIGSNGTYGYLWMTNAATRTYTHTVARGASTTDYNFYWVYPYYLNASGTRNVGNAPQRTPQYVYAKAKLATGSVKLPAVTNLTAVGVSGGVKVSWNPVAGAEGYLIYGKVGSNGTYGYLWMTGAGTTTYTYLVSKGASVSENNYFWVYPYHTDASGARIVGSAPQSSAWAKAK